MKKLLSLILLFICISTKSQELSLKYSANKMIYQKNIINTPGFKNNDKLYSPVDIEIGYTHRIIKQLYGSLNFEYQNMLFKNNMEYNPNYYFPGYDMPVITFNDSYKADIFHFTPELSYKIMIDKVFYIILYTAFSYSYVFGGNLNFKELYYTYYSYDSINNMDHFTTKSVFTYHDNFANGSQKKTNFYFLRVGLKSQLYLTPKFSLLVQGTYNWNYGSINSGYRKVYDFDDNLIHYVSYWNNYKFWQLKLGLGYKI